MKKQLESYWEIDLFKGLNFPTLEQVKSYILKHGDKDIVYEAKKVSGGKVKNSKLLSKIKKHMVCDLCYCIRRTVTDVVDIESGSTFKRIVPVPDDIVWLGSNTSCSNPACKDYKAFLKKTHSQDLIGYSVCSENGCHRTAVKGHKCEVCGGPSIDSPNHVSFHTFTQEKQMYRTSEYEILQKLRFHHDTGLDWIVDDKDKPVSTYMRKILRWDSKFWTDEEIEYFHQHENTLETPGYIAEQLGLIAHEEAIENGVYDDED